MVKGGEMPKPRMQFTVELAMIDKEKADVQDRKGMSPEECEIQDWCKALHCSEGDLRAAVKAVGNSAEAIQKHLLARR